MRKAKDAQQEKARKVRKAAERVCRVCEERARLQGELRVVQQEIQRLSPEVAAGEKRLDDWDEHIQGHHVAVQKRLRAEVRHL